MKDIVIYGANERVHDADRGDVRGVADVRLQQPVSFGLENKVVTSIAIKPSLLCNAKDLCKQRGISFSKLIEELLTENIL